MSRPRWKFSVDNRPISKVSLHSGDSNGDIVTNIKLVRALASVVLAFAVGGCGLVAEGAQIVATEVAAVYSPPTATARPTRAPATGVSPSPTRSPSGTPAAAPTPRPTARPSATPVGATPEPRPSARDTDLQIRVFGELWKTVKDNYIYENFNGVDWTALKPATESKIRAGLTSTEFSTLMGDIVESLSDDHSRYQSPIEVKEEQARFRGEQSYTGIGIQWDLNREKKYVFVLTVYPDSPAERAGIRPHDHILAVNGEPAVDAQGEAIVSKVRGPEGTSVTITVRQPGGTPRDLTVTRAKVTAKAKVDARLLDPAIAGAKRIGYVLLPTFYEEGIADQFRDAVGGLMKGGNLDGLIIDVRNNGGGSLGELERTLTVVANGVMGNQTTRAGSKRQLRARGEKVGNSQTVPLAILTSKSSVSAAEIFAGVLQGAKRAKTVGQDSAGNIEVLYTYKFEDGSQALIASETFRLPDGSNWEGTGVKADVPVPNSGWDEFTEASDPAIGAAAALFK